MATIEEKVETLESLLGQFIIHTDTALRRLEREVENLKDEMKEFKDEMKEFKDEMKKFKDEMEKENKRKNKEWSDLAKKMGTVLEDLIAPSLRAVISKYFKCEAKMEGQRIWKRKNGKSFEVDAIVLSEENVFMIEVRSTPKIEYVQEIFEKSKEFFKFFPEYKDKKLAVLYGGITFPEEIIKYATKKCIYILAWREWEYMDILNFEEVQK